jgi:type IV secretory pathway VirB3-like protein
MTRWWNSALANCLFWPKHSMLRILFPKRSKFFCIMCCKIARLNLWRHTKRWIGLYVNMNKTQKKIKKKNIKIPPKLQKII